MIRYDFPLKPLAPSNLDQRRWEHTSLRRRMLTGAWEEDLEDELARHLSPDRRESWGPSDLSSNPFEQITRQLSVLYMEAPAVSAPGDISPLLGREGYATRAGLWPLMSRVQQMVLGLRECIVRVEVIPHVRGGSSSNPGLYYRMVTPDCVYCEVDSDQPDIPVYYREYRLRIHPETGDQEWICDVLDIRDMSYPEFALYRVNQDGSLGEDVSELYMGHPGHRGEDYPFRNSAGVPFLPLSVYHAQKTGELWNFLDGLSQVTGSLNSAVLYSMFLHCVRDNAWSQKYILGASVAGLSQMDQGLTSRRAAIATDPSSILVLQADPDTTGQPLVGTFTPPISPDDLLESIAKYEMRVAISSGISPESLTRQNADPRSGYALSIDRAGQRESQRRFAPVFRVSDEDLLEKSAALCNRYLGTSLPETGYRVSYHSLDLSPEELRAQREDIIAKLGAGLISPIDAIRMLNPDLDETGAIDLLQKIRRERAEYL